MKIELQQKKMWQKKKKKNPQGDLLQFGMLEHICGEEAHREIRIRCPYSQKKVPDPNNEISCNWQKIQGVVRGKEIWTCFCHDDKWLQVQNSNAHQLSLK